MLRQQTQDKISFIFSRGLTAALLHIDTRREENIISLCPTRQLGTCLLPSLYLSQTEGHVHTLLSTTQSKSAHIFMPMLDYIFAIVHRRQSFQVIPKAMRAFFSSTANCRHRKSTEAKACWSRSLETNSSIISLLYILPLKSKMFTSTEIFSPLFIVGLLPIQSIPPDFLPLGNNTLTAYTPH